jgi:nicotinamide-nucleotide adenylyltransferase
MILASIDESMKSRIQIYFIPDLENHIKWIKLIDTLVPKFGVIFTNDELTKHLYSKRDVEVLSIPFVNRDVLSGTNIRDLIISDQKWGDLVPEGTRNLLNKINAKERLKIL